MVGVFRVVWYLLWHAEEAPLVQLFQRMKVEFVGEAGIDSGGLGKEAFLLLSRETSAYVGPTYRGWMRVCSGATPSSSAPPSPARPGLARREEAGLHLWNCEQRKFDFAASLRFAVALKVVVLQG